MVTSFICWVANSSPGGQAASGVLVYPVGGDPNSGLMLPGEYSRLDDPRANPHVAGASSPRL